MITDDIIITPEYWDQPGRIVYHYANKHSHVMYNVDRITDGVVLLWTVNAWGTTYQYGIPLDNFREDYERIDNPQSMYEQMDMVKLDVAT